MCKSIIINKKKYVINKNEENYLIYQYCYLKGIELPCFCYNENLEIAGNCRICLVEIKNMAKLYLSCATKIEDKMIIKTKNTRLERARKGIMEFLLINHPLDCPICDQGGECDLQNIARNDGLDRGRYYELKKRSVIDKDSGFFIKTTMTRCIHCTRCVRFFKEIIGISGFSLVSRGESTEIVVNKLNLLSVLSGNVVDLCPVGALTSKIYDFKGRSWELNKYENIDIVDTMCSSICLDLRNNKILRILPVSDLLLNNDWITNITRYFFDMLSYNRLLKPFLILNKSNIELTWDIVTKIIVKNLIQKLIFNNNINFFLSDFLDLECLYHLKNFNLSIGILNINLNKFIYNNIDFNFFYFFNSNLNNLQNYILYFFLVLNLRLKMPLLNAILRKKLKKKIIKIYSLGFLSKDISLNVINLGNNLFEFYNILENKNKFIFFSFYNSFFLSSFFFLKNYKNIACIVGENYFFIKNNFKLLINFFFLLQLSYNNLYILFTNVVDLNYQAIGLKKNFYYDYKFSFIYSFTFNNIIKKKKSFSILQNSFFFVDLSLKNYNVVLPTTYFFEYSGLFLNFEGRLRKKLKIYSYNNNLYNLKSNNEILKYLTIILKRVLFFYNFDFNLVKYFNNLIIFVYDYFLKFYNYIFFILKINIKIFYNYNIKNFNINFYDYIVNIYQFKDFYKSSNWLKKALQWEKNFSTTFFNYNKI